MHDAGRATMNPLHVVVLLLPLLTLVCGLEILQPAEDNIVNAMDGVTVKWIYNSSSDPLEADFQIGQMGHKIIPRAIVELNISSILFGSQYVTELLGPSAFVRIWNADWILLSRTTELAIVTGFTFTTYTSLPSMTPKLVPHTTTVRLETMTSTSGANSARSTTDSPKATVTVTAITDPTLHDSKDGLSTSTKAGIGVGVSVGGIMIIAAAVFLFVRNRRKQATTKEGVPRTTTSTPKKEVVTSEPAELQTTTKHESYELPA
ncbi:hypothetical protein BDV28DRAFT_70263 [Aspergillus coremiiformis]|uniref:Mid2 domain-containing protein n=1 Tax=Aspergillus coremiiformis TaxID=138285 RepID=A0A5N6ZBP2_9EURO|nr:hypothetical protein BDV28DRAFT_70263 [Aspergillus coremiiformis]